MEADPSSEEARELLRRVRRIRLRTRQVVNDALAGQYHAAFKGRGMEFEEVRPYQVGDDVRSIDWNVSARLGDPHVKLFREERELTVVLAVDVSGSQSFGTTGRFKRDLVAEFAATVAFSAAMNNDKIGLLSFTDRVEGFVPPEDGRRRIVREILACGPRGGSRSVRRSRSWTACSGSDRSSSCSATSSPTAGIDPCRRPADDTTWCRWWSAIREHELLSIGLVESTPRRGVAVSIPDDGRCVGASPKPRTVFGRIGDDGSDA